METEAVRVIVEHGNGFQVSDITAVISCVAAIITMVVTILYVKYTKGILEANKESAKLAKEQLVENGRVQEEAKNVALYNERLKIYCKWIKLIEDARSDKKRSYTIEEKTSLQMGTKFLFGDEAAEKLVFFIDNYEIFCQYEGMYRKDGKSTVKEQEVRDKFYNANSLINELLSQNLILYEKENHNNKNADTNE